MTEVANRRRMPGEPTYRDGSSAMITARLSCLHVRPAGRLAYGRIETNRMLAETIESLMALECRPDLVIATGDLTDCGLESEYEMLQELLDPLSMPIYLVPG